MIALLLYLAIGSATPARCPGTYVGLKYQELPNGLQMSSGGLIGDVEGQGYAVWYVKCDVAGMLWLEKLHRDPDGKPIFEVIDVLHVPSLQANERLVYGENICRRGGQGDSEIVAIVDARSEGQYYTTVIRAWRASRRDGRLLEIEIQGIDCYNECWGV